MALSNKEFVTHKDGWVCPECRSIDVYNSSNVTFCGDYVKQEAECLRCKATWDNIFSLTGYDSLQVSKEH